MNRIFQMVLIFLFVILTIVTTKLKIGIDKIITFSALYIIIFFVFLFEKKDIDAKKMAIISTLATMGGIFRIPFAFIPGLQPTTFIVAVSGYSLGPTEGFIVGSISAFISNFFLGHGPWTLWQMLGWGLCGFSFGLIKGIRLNKYLFAFLCGLWGYLYGIILDMWYVVGFVRPINIYAILIGVVGSFPFDTIHAIGNILFSVAFSKRFIHIIQRFKMRFDIEYIN